ncbi:MAG TPA: peptidoglycan bridge formation glycyltransferase FemA/FemB family protein [Candidatus Saccharibacteria bacterium]|nr:peptidoglycan bridge formation glycyltransferase FemA/FemB family protein [Candidatus Saccharibacteria bacterium]
MTARYATSDESKKWNDIIIANPDGGNVFASVEFAKQKEMGGYKHFFVMVDSLAVTVLEKRTLLGKLWYLPKGPGATSVKDVLRALKAIKPLAMKRGVFAIRIESELKQEYGKDFEEAGLAKARHVIPNPSTILLDLHPKLGDILAQLPQKGRHAIRRAERDGVTIKQVPATDENVRIMHTLLSETAKGQFGLRSPAYYKTFWQRFEKSGYGQLFFAYVGGEVVAGAYAMVFGKKSTYKDGASIRERTVYGASHLLQWEVIKWAKKRGAVIHDFCGSPPSSEIHNTNHPHYGVGRFKLSFNKTVTDYIGCYDYILKPSRHKLWRSFVESLTMRLYYYRKRETYY